MKQYPPEYQPTPYPKSAPTSSGPGVSSFEGNMSFSNGGGAIGVAADEPKKGDTITLTVCINGIPTTKDFYVKN